MSCGHVYASVLWLGCVWGTCFVLLHLLHRADEDFAKGDIRSIRRLWLVYSLAAGVTFLPHVKGGSPMVWVAYGLLAVYLILSAVMDSVLEMVCDFFHYIGVVGGFWLLLYYRPEAGPLWELLMFVGIQWFVFRKMYGPADVAAFVLCAMYLVAEGRSLLGLLVHMAVTFLLLGVVQGLQRNIEPGGNLKRPVALFPYITLAFFLII